jgi:quercetin dioxygenase-like cupin family protein
MKMPLNLAVACALAMAFPLAAHAQTGPTQTSYTLPGAIHWIPDTEKGMPPGSFSAVLRGKRGDTCGVLRMAKFPDGFEFPWHVNDAYLIFTVLKGTLVIGFDKNHLKAAERALPAGSIMQGLATEPHYGRAIGETIFEIYGPPCEMVRP